MNIIEFRRQRRRQRAAEYSRSYRRTKSESRAPGAREIGGALLDLMLDAYAERASAGAPAELLDRLALHGYDRDAAQAAITALTTRHVSMLTLSRQAAIAGAAH